MPTINEVWEQALNINANLSVIHNDLGDLKNCCKTTNDNIKNLIDTVEKSNEHLEKLRDVITTGFATVSEGITAIQARQDLTNKLLVFQIRQQNTMICALENISRNTCALLNESNQQTKLQTKLVADMAKLTHMYASTNPNAALIFARSEEQREAIEKCCPPEPYKPVCVYEQCPAPSLGKGKDEVTDTSDSSEPMKVTLKKISDSK